MSRPPLTIWEQAQLQGYSRRDFLQFCSWIAAAAGIHASGVPRVVEALDSQPRPTVVWFHFQECTCCSESFIRSNHPIVSDIILDKISLDYSETLQAAAGHQAHEALKTAMEKNKGKYLMLVEGSVPLAEDGVYCCIGGRSAVDIVKEAAAGAAAGDLLGQLRVERLCPGREPEPDEGYAHRRRRLGRAPHQGPRLPADRRGHGGRRRPLPHVRQDSAARRHRAAESLLLAARPRYLLPPAELRRGPVCRGVRRREREARLLPLQDGMPGAGHLQRLRRHPVERGRQLPHPVGPRVHRVQRGQVLGQRPVLSAPGELPGFGIETTADTVGAVVGAVTVAGIAAHAISTNVRKRQLIAEEIRGSEQIPEKK